MLGRTRYLIPLAMTVAVLVGAAFPAPWWLLLGLAVGGGVALEVILARTAEERVRIVADQVVAFAADVEATPELLAEAGAEWQRLTTALVEVAGALRQRLDALRDERERVERVLDAIPSAVLLFSDGALLFANPAAQDLFTLSGDTIGLTPLRALGVAGLAHAVDEVSETGRDLDVSVTRDGRELLAHAGRIADGEVALIASDLTDAHRLQDMRRDFVANASHELKTPVTGMQAIADSLDMAMDRDPAIARKMVARIQSEATRLASLVRDLLDLTRLEEEVGGRARERLALSALTTAQVERLRPLAADKGVTLTCRCAPDVSVIGIAEDLKIIIGNLVLNAVQYNAPGGRVDVELGRRGGHVVLAVSDTGIGIPEVDQDRIFERFYRVDKARSRAAGGTGLGLALVKHGVERHCGQVAVSSVLGEGTTFTVTLPVDGGSTS